MTSHRQRLRTHTLANDLCVVLSEDHLVPAVAICLWYDVGSRHEEPGRTGFAHLFEHLMFQGSRNVGPMEHFNLLHEVGATLNGTTSFDRTTYFETVPTHAFELALWLEADRMATLLDALTQENLDNQRDVVKNERREAYDNRPYGTARERLAAALFPPAHPYHHLPIGSMADLDAASLEDASTFFQRHYGPANAVLAVVGDVEIEQAAAAVERYFGPVPAGAPRSAAPDGTIAPATSEVRETLHEPVPNEALFEAYRVPPDGTPEGDAIAVALEVLTGGPAARLTRRLVRDEQLAQEVRGGSAELVGGVDIGTITIHARSGASLARIDAIVDEELTRLGRNGANDDEVERAQTRLERQWLETTASVMGRADQLCRFATHFDDPTLVDRVVPRIRAVTAAGVRSAAAAWLLPSNRAVLEYRTDPATQRSAA